jgi:hypothetical protein
MYFNPYDPTHWFALYVGTLYGMAQTFYGIGTGPEITRNDLGRLGRRY